MFGLKAHFAKEAINKMLATPDFTADTAIAALERYKLMSWEFRNDNLALLDQIVDKTPESDRASIAFKASSETGMFEGPAEIKLRKRALDETKILEPKERAIMAFNIWGKTVKTFLKSFDTEFAERAAQVVYDSLKEMPVDERIELAIEMSEKSRGIHFRPMSKDCFELAIRAVEEKSEPEQVATFIKLYNAGDHFHHSQYADKLNKLVDTAPKEDRFAIASYIYFGTAYPEIRARSLQMMETHIGDSRPTDVARHRVLLQEIHTEMAPPFKAVI